MGKPKILIVEDSSLSFEVISGFLSENGFSIVRASDGREALHLVREEDPDLIVLDIVLPHINGLEVCETIKKNENYSQYHHIPVIMVTSLENMEDRVRGVEAGADDFINKPVDERLLLARINSLLSKKLKFESIKEQYSQAKKEAVIDELTGLFNYRFFKSQIEDKIKDASKKLQPVSILLIDIDDFKKYNDSHGHQEGNRLLKIVARELKNSTRFEDYVIRYGGEEFIIILTNQAMDGALKIAERMRTRIEKVRIDGDPSFSATISIGVSSYPESAESSEDLLRLADEAMYRAKAGGKNRIEVSRETED